MLKPTLYKKKTGFSLDSLRPDVSRKRQGTCIQEILMNLKN